MPERKKTFWVTEWILIHLAVRVFWNLLRFQLRRNPRYPPTFSDLWVGASWSTFNTESKEEEALFCQPPPFFLLTYFRVLNKELLWLLAPAPSTTWSTTPGSVLINWSGIQLSGIASWDRLCQKNKTQRRGFSWKGKSPYFSHDQNTDSFRNSWQQKILRP